MRFSSRVLHDLNTSFLNAGCTVNQVTTVIITLINTHRHHHHISPSSWVSYCHLTTDIWPTPLDVLRTRATLRCWHCVTVAYFEETLQKSTDVEVCRRLQSASTSTLIVPSTRRSTLGDRDFPVVAARARNTLPSSAKAKTSLQSLRRVVKTTLFEADIWHW